MNQLCKAKSLECKVTMNEMDNLHSKCAEILEDLVVSC